MLVVNIYPSFAGKMPRPDQMNINVATWGRLLKKNINLKNVDQSRTENEPNSGRKCREYINCPLLGQFLPKIEVLEKAKLKFFVAS